MSPLKSISILFILLFGTASIAAESPSTYFQYSADEIKELSEAKSKERITKDELIKWDEIAKNLVQKKTLGEDVGRMYAYLYIAQQDAAFLSFQTQGDFIGSLAPISAGVLNLFFPSVPQANSDVYSNKLAKIVLAKIKERLNKENAEIRDFPIGPSDAKLKASPQFQYGIKLASYKPWLLKDPTQFLAPPPPEEEAFWKDQAKTVKQTTETATAEKKQISKFWAGESWPGSGNSIDMVNKYMFSQSIPLTKILCVRSTLAEAGVDVDIALFYSKYTYVAKRPNTVDPTIQMHVKLPKHPSYPSGHSTWMSAWAVILSHYFPEKKNEWFQLAEEAGQSRIWAGLHFPIDHQAGKTLGKKLGEAILQSPKLCK